LNQIKQSYFIFCERETVTTKSAAYTGIIIVWVAKFYS